MPRFAEAHQFEWRVERMPIHPMPAASGRFIVFYLLKVYPLVGGAVFLSAGLIFLTLLALLEVQEYLAAQQSIQNRLVKS